MRYWNCAPPVVILEYDKSELRLGGGANAVHNLRTLGGWPLPYGVVGRDEQGRRLRALLQSKRIPVAGLRSMAGYSTPLKSRILAGGVHVVKQQIVRIDRATRVPERAPVRAALLRAMRAYRGPLDGVLVSDYGFGLLTPGLAQAAIDYARRRRVCRSRWTRATRSAASVA